MQLLSVVKVMKKNARVLKISKINKKRTSDENKDDGGVKSQKEIMGECRLELSMADYGKLMKLAMREGCSPEELVARQIARLVK